MKKLLGVGSGGSQSHTWDSIFRRRALQIGSSAK